jgi:hypothetical protein
MKEDGPPFAMDPVTLETIGRYDFDGQVQSPTFTAHPKFDPDTGEMVCYGYEAGGDGHDASCDIVVYTIDKDGKKTEECWYKAPFCGMIHDCAITKNYLILPLTPIKANVDRLKKGGNHFAWDPQEDQWYGIVPRRNGKPEDIIWLRADNGNTPITPTTTNQLTSPRIPRPRSRLLRRRLRQHRRRSHRRLRQRLLLLPARLHRHHTLHSPPTQQTRLRHLPLGLRPQVAHKHPRKALPHLRHQRRVLPRRRPPPNTQVQPLLAMQHRPRKTLRLCEMRPSRWRLVQCSWPL